MSRGWVLVAVAACGGARREPVVANHGHGSETSCATRATELTAYLKEVVDEKAKPAPPWPTGDAETDKIINAARDRLREAMNRTADDPASQLSEGIKRGPVDDTLDGCPQARDAWANISSFEGPDRLTKAVTAIGDGVKACECRVNIPLIRAALYVIVRGPD